MIKVVKNDRYVIFFNLENGREILKGINGHDDPFVLDYPSLLDIGIMGHCLNRCKICYQGDTTQPHMTLENFKTIIDQSKDSVMQIALGGRGDPNLHPDFQAILAYTNKNRIVPNYTTSGNSLTPEQVEMSKMCGAVAVSDYDQHFTYNALNMFMNNNIKTNIHFVLSTERFDRAMDILDGKDIWNGQFDLSKLNAIIFLLFKPQGRGKDRYDLIPSDDQVRTFIKKIREPKVNFKLGMDSCLVNKLALLDNLTEDEAIFLDTCEASRASMYITPDMRAVPCSFADYSCNGVSITQDNPIKEIWANSEPFNRCRGALSVCRTKCPYMER